MAAKNPNSLTHQGEFHARRPTQPPSQKGHQPGQQTQAPTFSAQTLPAGTAPPANTFQPANTVIEPAAVTGHPTLHPGATSADVHTGLGHPGSGQTGRELRHDGQHGRTREKLGLAAQGAQQGHRSADLGSADERVDERQRGLGREEGVMAGKKGKVNAGGAEEEAESTTASMEAGGAPKGAGNEGFINK
ncbi:hypothetical protein L873DRAFT_886794 [Choiromyces venosus 120613-1]|uniref:Uncharacterized protein n=1 Tax=Choiromyces venosus 120613-1 TaxID=1336337 RepID=A0A3N4K0S1_9PEZI|nr:hypothetical protein L873DRAFT_886794 [Choiromyces venosus 120613-1]